MKQEELNDILRLHKLWLEGKDGGMRANLHGADLIVANLQGAELKLANLKGANLFEASLEGANLFEASLEGANLFEASLEGANLAGADLEGADLQGADLQGANLVWANLAGANLRGANIDHSAWPLWCGSLSVKICARIAAQLAYHCVRACQSVTDDEDVVAFCNDPIVIRLANRFHRVKACGEIEAEGGKEWMRR